MCIRDSLIHTKVLVFAVTVWVWCTSLVHTIWPTERAFFSAELIQPIAGPPIADTLCVVGSIALVEVAFREPRADAKLTHGTTVAGV